MADNTKNGNGAAGQGARGGLEPAICARLEEMAKRRLELHDLLASSEVATNPGRLRVLSRELGTLSKSLDIYEQLKKIWTEKEEAQRMLETETDAEMQGLAREELQSVARREPTLVEEARSRFLLDDEDASRNAIVEIRAGTGGALRGGPLRDVPAVRRGTRVEGGADVGKPDGPGGVPRDHLRRLGAGGLPDAAVRVGRTPGAEGAGDGDAGTHPHLGVHGGGAA